MILTELKNILAQIKTANVLELSQRLHVEPQVVRDMLAHWIRKGKVRQAQKVSGCGSKCSKCSPLQTEIYELIQE